MKFNTKEELLEFIESTDISLISLVVDEVPATNDTIVSLEESVTIDTLSSKPTVKACITSDVEYNILVVENYNHVPLSCSTGKVDVLGRSLLMNICEMDGKVLVHLDISLNENTYKNVPFVLLKSSDNKSDYIMSINKDILTHEST